MPKKRKLSEEDKRFQDLVAMLGALGMLPGPISSDPRLARPNAASPYPTRTGMTPYRYGPYDQAGTSELSDWKRNTRRKTGQRRQLRLNDLQEAFRPGSVYTDEWPWSPGGVYYEGGRRYRQSDRTRNR